MLGYTRDIGRGGVWETSGQEDAMTQPVTMHIFSDYV